MITLPNAIPPEADTTRLSRTLPLTLMVSSASADPRPAPLLVRAALWMVMVPPAFAPVVAVDAVSPTDSVRPEVPASRPVSLTLAVLNVAPPVPLLVAPLATLMSYAVGFVPVPPLVMATLPFQAWPFMTRMATLVELAPLAFGVATESVTLQPSNISLTHSG